MIKKNNSDDDKEEKEKEAPDHWKIMIFFTSWVAEDINHPF